MPFPFPRPYDPNLYKPPGAKPLIGHTIEIMKQGTKDQFEIFRDTIAKSKGNIGMHMSFFGPSGGSLMMLNRPEYIEYIQKTNFENYIKGHLFRNRFSKLLGDNGIFVADGHAWKTQRKMASHIFSVHQFRTWVQSVVHGEIDSVHSILDTLTEQGTTTVKLPDLFFRFTLSSFTKMAFSSDIQILRADPASLNEENRFSVAFDFIQGVINKRMTNPFWKLTERITAEGREGERCIKDIRAFGLKVVDERLAMRAAGASKTDGKDGKDLLDLFMDLTTDREDLLIVVLNFLIAGRDTTAQGLSWMFYELMVHPEYLEEIRKEMRTVLRDPETGGMRKLEYEATKQMVFTTACFYETLRLHPPVPKNGKRAVRDDVIVPQGKNVSHLPSLPVKAGQMLGWSDWVMARNTDVWGENAAEFDPWRFVETADDGSRSVRNYGQWKFHVFNGGPRLCLGMALATYEALAFCAATLDRYDFGWASKEQGQQADWPLKYLNSVTHPSQVYTATVSRR